MIPWRGRYGTLISSRDHKFNIVICHFSGWNALRVISDLERELFIYNAKSLNNNCFSFAAGCGLSTSANVLFFAKAPVERVAAFIYVPHWTFLRPERLGQPRYLDVPLARWLLCRSRWCYHVCVLHLKQPRANQCRISSSVRLGPHETLDSV